MKRRVFKKWVNRYITPEIKDLPLTDTTCKVIQIDDDRELLIRLSHRIVNGYITAEGSRSRISTDKLMAVKRTADVIREIKSKYNHVYLRTKPEYVYGSVYVRLITEDPRSDG